MGTDAVARLEIAGPDGSKVERAGTVIEVLDNGYLVVEWDDGLESMVSPSGSHVDVHGAESPPTHLGCQIDLRVSQSRHECRAVAWMDVPRGTFMAVGVAHRHPDDPQVPLIGEELAIARCLQTLAAQLETAAEAAIRHPGDAKPHLL